MLEVRLLPAFGEYDEAWKASWEDMLEGDTEPSEEFLA